MIFVTFITTCMVSLVAILVWRINLLLVIFLFLVFGCLDGAYLSSALTKVPAGAWFTLLLAAILSSIFILWRYGKESQWSAEAEDRFHPSHLIKTDVFGKLSLTEEFGGLGISTVNGVGIFFDKIGDKVPIVFTQFARKFSACPEITIFFHMRSIPIPSIPESERYVISRTTIPSCYRMTIRHGYADKIVTPDLSRLIIEQLVLYITRDKTALSDGNSASSKHHTPEIKREIDAIEKAYAAQSIYILGKEQMKVKQGTNLVRRALLWAFLWIRENSRTKMADLNIPTEMMVEVGFVKEI